MNFRRTAAERDLLAQPQILGWRQVHGHSIALEPRHFSPASLTGMKRQVYCHVVPLEAGGDDAGARGKRKGSFGSRQSPHKMREAARAVAAHLGRTAVAVVKIPGPIGLTGRA